MEFLQRWDYEIRETNMKRVWARISIEMWVTDEEYEEFAKHAKENEEGISDELAARFVTEGTLSDDSYMPEELYDL